MHTTQSVFDRYQVVRARVPHVSSRGGWLEIQSQMDIADQADAFDGGETMFPGADRRLDQLCERD